VSSEYVYPLKTDGKATSTLQESPSRQLLNLSTPSRTFYSPTHSISINRPNEREAVVKFEKNQACSTRLSTLLRDRRQGHRLYHVAATADQQRKKALSGHDFAAPGDFQNANDPADMYWCLIRPAGMRGPKMDQARRALKYCLSNLNPNDRFGVMNSPQRSIAIAMPW